MQEADEQDTCRICSAPAEPDQPLFHPCKCSGTIRYIHQDCLTTWLAHSKKKNCDVCKHPYSFTKVYASDMPSSLPPVLLVRRLLQHALMAILFVLRAVAVAAIWLGVLPWVTVWTWRMYFAMGESTAWWISNRPRPPMSEADIFYDKVRYESSVPPPKNFLAKVTSHPLWLALSADIFTGQIIASLIVLTFVAVFLLREWISQNARPGVFEEEEALPDDQAAAQPAAPAQQPARPQPPLGQQEAAEQPHPPPDGFPQAETLVQRQIDTMRALNEMNRQNIDPEIAMDPDRWFLLEDEDLRRNVSWKKKNKAKQSDAGDDKMAQKTPGSDDEEIEAIRRKMFHRRIHLAKSTSGRRRITHRNLRSPPVVLGWVDEANVDVTGEFVFRPPTSSEPSSSSTPTDSKVEDQPSSPFPSVALQPPSADIPFSLRGWQPLPPTGSTHSFQSFPARPPLPTATMPELEPIPPPPFSFSPGRTPTGSPRLATYRAPEELEAGAGPSRVGHFNRAGEEDEAGVHEAETKDEDEYVLHESGYNYQDRREDEHSQVEFDERQTDSDGDMDSEGRRGDSDVDMEAEHRRYFREREAQRVEELEGGVEGARLPGAFDDSDSEDDSDEEGEGRNDGDREIPHDIGDEDENFREVEEDDEEEPDAGDLFDDDGQWEEAEEAQAVPAPQNVAGAPAPAQGANQDADAAGAELNDEIDGNVEDDMEGAMEAIGLRGPVFGVFQNAALMIFVLDTAIGIGVWIPFTIGKTTALLSLDPRRLMQVLHLPIRAMRLVTDPIVDFVAFVVVDLTIPWIMGVFRGAFWLFVFLARNSIRALMGSDIANGVADFSSGVFNHSAGLVKSVAQFAAQTTTTVMQDSTSNSTVVSSIPDYLGFTESYFALLGKEVRVSATKAHATWLQLALGSGPASRVFAISLGYIVVSFVFCLYLNLLTVGNARTAGLAVRNAVRQQLLVLKVATFIFIELVTFPLGCGIVLDLCTVWLFPEANMQSRVAFFAQAPLTAMFYHWVAGTMFMYSFAVLLSGCRSVMRPGAMWFIKDPQDQNSHPIRDILDRPTFTQLRKICVSGLMYSFVVACVVGSVAGLLVLGSKSIMPFRWKNREPLSNVPVDLLFLHLVLPYTMHYFRPKRAIKHVSTTVWKFLATRLRLTSYFFGGRHSQEEYTPKNLKDNFLRSELHVMGEDDVHDGTFRRVPATDNLALPRDMRATAAVTAEGEPINNEAKELMALQDAEAEKAKRDVKDDYMIVYMPPHFRYRIIVFITLLWIFGAILLGFAVALPIQLGRSFFKLFTPRDIHDGYSLIVGFYLVWMCYLIAKAVDRLDKRRQRRSGDGPRADLHVLVLKRGLLWIAKTVYMVFFLGIIIPILLAAVIDLYMVLPIRFTLDPTMTPRIRVVDTWALGLLYAKIALHAHRIQPPNRITRGLQHIIAHGWTRPDPIMATKEVIAPLGGGLLGMILFPGVVFRSIQHFFPDVPLDNRFIFMHVYPSVFILAGTIRSAIVLFGMLSSWSQAIRDKEFLVEMRLKNHEPEKVDAIEGEGAVVPEGEENGEGIVAENGIVIEEDGNHQP